MSDNNRLDSDDAIQADDDTVERDSERVLEEGHVDGLVRKFESQANIFPEDSQARRVAEWCAEEAREWFDRKAVERYGTGTVQDGGRNE